jgi:peptidoglycan/LPS O-acetylase OafA/YrhL
MTGIAALLLSPVLVMVLASRLVDFGCTWPPRIAVLFAAAAPAVVAVALSQQADAITNAAAVAIAPAFGFYGLIAGGIAFAFLRPRRRLPDQLKP